MMTKTKTEVQLDCRIEQCAYRKNTNCEYPYPELRLNLNGTFVCWSRCDNQCICCGKIFTEQSGFIVSPDGVLCNECWHDFLNLLRKKVV